VVEVRQGNHMGEPTCNSHPWEKDLNLSSPSTALVRCPAPGAGEMSCTELISPQSCALQVTLWLDPAGSAGTLSEALVGATVPDYPRADLSLGLDGNDQRCKCK